MSGFKDQAVVLKKIPLKAAGLLLLLVIALLLIGDHSDYISQSLPAKYPHAAFVGEYRIGDGPWKPIVEGKHIPATKGDVLLRGVFHLVAPSGEDLGPIQDSMPIAFFANHINLTFLGDEGNVHVSDIENPQIGRASCAAGWIEHSTMAGGPETVEILIQNPHALGNEKAVDQLLENLSIWVDPEFERDMAEKGEVQRTVGLVLLVVSLVVLGIALFSFILHIEKNSMIALIGLTTLFASGYIYFCSFGISFRHHTLSINTVILGVSAVLYLLFLSAYITQCFHITKKIGTAAITVLGIVDGIIFLVPLVSELRFYDILSSWAIIQSLANMVLCGCLIHEYKVSTEKRWLFLLAILPMLAFEVDLFAVAVGWWADGMLSMMAFMLLAMASLVMIWSIIPNSIKASNRAKEIEVQNQILEAEKNSMEAQLKENRISIMLSQIRPHFIYNTLGTIERMCVKEPAKAAELVHDFSLYLRGNFREIDSTAPIPFEEEIRHVQHYANIELVRFPDMNVRYELESTDFFVPALSVQPLVENAIKHGLMGLESGGTVTVRSYETQSHFCIEVEDDGIGFDVQLPVEEKEHLGLRNIRGRLSDMINGQLAVESVPGKGTKATIRIPKEDAQ